MEQSREPRKKLTYLKPTDFQQRQQRTYNGKSEVTSKNGAEKTEYPHSEGKNYTSISHHTQKST